MFHRTLRHQCALCMFLTSAALTIITPAAADSTDSALREHIAPGPGTFYGWACASVGDTNADGVADYLVGAPSFGTGCAYLYSGADGSMLRSLSAGGGLDFFGYSIAAMGDLDGDGHDDFAVGAPLLHIEGLVVVYSGRTGAALWSRAADQVAEIFGWSIAAIDDLDDDGRRDLLIGAAFYDSGYPVPEYHGRNRGRILICSGASGGLIREIIGAEPEDAIGFALAGLSDINEDGVPDFAATTYGLHEVQFRSGATGAILARVAGQGGSHFGWSIANVGDVTGDDIADLAIGADGYMFGGVRTGLVTVVNARTRHAVFNVLGDDGAKLGTSVAGVGDLNQDGYPDIAAGATVWPSTPSNDARVEVYSGFDGALIKVLTCDETAFGSAVAGMPDVNGDGSPEILVGHDRFNGYGKAYVFSGEPPEPGSMAASSFGAAWIAPGEALATDFNRDGFAEALTIATGLDRVAVRENAGDGSFFGATHLTVGRRPVAAVAADLDRDGDCDLAVVLEGERKIVLYWNTHGILLRSGAIKVARRPSSIVAADFDNDGRMDLAVAGRRDKVVEVLLQNPAFASRAMHQRFKAPRSIALTIEPTSLFAARLDADGRTDLLAFSASDGAAATLMSRGLGRFRAERITSLAPEAKLATVGRFDSDDLADFAWYDAASAQLTVLHGLGDGRFGQVIAVFSTNEPPGAVIAARLDGDARDDLAWTNPSAGSVTCALMGAAAGQPLVVTHSTVGSPRWLAGADCDGDDDADLIVINAQGAATLLLNEQLD